MKKALKILQHLKPTEKNYRGKAKLLSEIIADSDTGHICPNSLIRWADDVGLKTRSHSEDHCDWTTVSGR